MRGLFFGRILSLIVLLALPFSSAFAAVAYVHELQGTMTGQYGTAAPQALKIGDTLDSGVVLTTGAGGTAIVKFEDGQIIALSPNTSFSVNDYRYNAKQVKDSNIVFRLVQGGLRFVTGLIGSTNSNAFKINVGTATIGVRGTTGNALFSPGTQDLQLAPTDGSLSLVQPPPIGTLVIGPDTFIAGRLGTPFTPRPFSAAPLSLRNLVNLFNGLKFPDARPVFVRPRIVKQDELLKDEKDLKSTLQPTPTPTPVSR